MVMTEYVRLEHCDDGIYMPGTYSGDDGICTPGTYSGDDGMCTPGTYMVMTEYVRLEQ